MIYDFKSLPDRSTSGSLKWDSVRQEQGKTGLADGIVPLSLADMELKTAPEIIEALSAFIKDDSVLGYTGPTPQYFSALMDWMERRHNWSMSPSWVHMSPGVVPALYASAKCFVKRGQGIIIFSPVYHPFKKSIESSGRLAVEVDLLEDKGYYEIDWPAFEKAAQDKNNKALMFCSPHNPVGRVWTKEELKKLSEICLENDIPVLSDEIHHDLIMPGHKHTVYATLSQAAAENCVIYTAPSKSFNLAGLQTSNIIIPNPELGEKFSNQMAAASLRLPNAMGLVACRAAYGEGEAWLEELILHINRNKELAENFMSQYIPQIKISPMQGTYLQWWDCRALGMDYEKLGIFLKKKPC
ncbi:MAG: putative C-S lyase [Clostridiales bacterium]|nr:putative C-S lyase [Clostridiales bacterium]